MFDVKINLSNMDLKAVFGHSYMSNLPTEQIQILLSNVSTATDSADMFMQMYYILDHLDFTELALEMQDKATALKRVYRIFNDNKNNEYQIRLLAIVGRGNLSDNAPLDYITDHCNIQLDLLYVLDDLTIPSEIPDHDAVIVALGEKDCHHHVLNFLQKLRCKWPKPWLNAPEKILSCARDQFYKTAKNIPDIIIPETYRIGRQLPMISFYPATIRPIDTHSGKGLQLIHDKRDFFSYLENSNENEFYISRFYETKRQDRLYRKIRIALIDGEAYICHVAISENWIVHYISAQMHLNAKKIFEENQLMSQFDKPNFAHFRTILRGLASKIDLDFVVLDCEFTSDNQIIIFEADNRGWIHATDSHEIFPYKKEIMQKAFDAFRNMIIKKIAIS